MAVPDRKTRLFTRRGDGRRLRMLKGMAEVTEPLSGEGLAPGVPADYYRRIYDAEEHHWWYRGMRSITEALLAQQLELRRQSLLDLGCGTGGFLAWAGRTGSFDRLAGVDISSAAISYARDRVAEAELHVGKLEQLPFEDGSFDLIAMNDVLQHIPEDEIGRILAQGRRVLRPDKRRSDASSRTFGLAGVQCTGARRDARVGRIPMRAHHVRERRDLTVGACKSRGTPSSFRGAARDPVGRRGSMAG